MEEMTQLLLSMQPEMYLLKVCNVRECLTRRFRSSILRFIPHCEVYGPELSIAESCEVRAVGGEHETNYDPRKVAPWLSR